MNTLRWQKGLSHLGNVKNKHNIHTATASVIKSVRNIPGPLSLPIVGTLYQYLPLIGLYSFDTLHTNGMKKYRKFGPIVREEVMPGTNIIWLFKPEDYETLFRYEGPYPERRSHLALLKHRTIHRALFKTGGLLPTNGPEWWRLRRNLQKGLTGPEAASKFVMYSDEIIQNWMERLKFLKYPIDDFLPELSRLFLELTGSILLGVRFNSFSNEEMLNDSRTSQIIDATYAVNSAILKTDSSLQLWQKFRTPLFRKLERNHVVLSNVAVEIVNHKMFELEQRAHYKLEIPSSLFESYLQLPEIALKEMIGVVCDFLLAGIDTTAYSTSFLLYHLAKHPEVQEKLYEETSTLLPTDETSITSDILAEANYAKAVLKETLRLQPISVGIGRILTEDVVFSGYTVPAGTPVVTQNQISCRLEEYFPQPDSYIPERWIKKLPGYKGTHPFLVLPFGFGKRSCIARRLAEQNMLVLLMKINRNFRLEWNGAKVLGVVSKLINKPKHPIILKLHRR